MPDRIHELLGHDDYIGRQLIRSWLAGGVLQRLAFSIHQADIMAARPTPAIQALSNHSQPPDRKGLYFADQLSNTVARWCVIALADPEQIELAGNEKSTFTQLHASIHDMRGYKESYYIDPDRHLNPNTVQKLFKRFEEAFDNRVKLPQLPMEKAVFFQPHYQAHHRRMARQLGKLLDEWNLRQPYYKDDFWVPHHEKIDVCPIYRVLN